jgi:hypothetical protein
MRYAAFLTGTRGTAVLEAGRRRRVGETRRYLSEGPI